MINDEFARFLVSTFNDPDKNGVHLLFNQWSQHAPDDVKDKYVQAFVNDPRYASFLDERHYAEPLELSELAALPAGSLGRAYHDWIVDNNLTAAIATNYREFHQILDKAGMLDGMPEDMKYAVLRGFQTHDFLHVLTGYDSSGRGEIALQAFCLAQLRFPYFGMWMSVVTTRMTFVDPDMIVPIMDAITDGWRNGRRTPNLQCEKWETMLDEPLEAVRARYDVAVSAAMETV
ncbi:MAG: Coq4 family protein [Acidimicrobiales bacterium]